MIPSTLQDFLFVLNLSPNDEVSYLSTSTYKGKAVEDIEVEKRWKTKCYDGLKNTLYFETFYIHSEYDLLDPAIIFFLNDLISVDDDIIR